MCTRRVLSLLMVFALALVSNTATGQGPQTPKLGKPITEADISGWDLNVMPDGTGLPPGSGTPADGARIYAAKCVGCHGPEGKGGSNAKLVGGEPIRTIDAEKTIANFWPYATTFFDFVRRTMPFRQPRSLTNDEVYALTAYIFSLNKVIGANDTMNAQTLPKVRMPNRDGFIIRFPDKTP